MSFRWKIPICDCSWSDQMPYTDQITEIATDCELLCNTSTMVQGFLKLCGVTVIQTLSLKFDKNLW